MYDYIKNRMSKKMGAYCLYNAGYWLMAVNDGCMMVMCIYIYIVITDDI